MGASFRAIIYAHGMGDQERYGELSNLVHSLGRASKSRTAEQGVLTPAFVQNEPLHGGNGKDISYLNLVRQDQQELRCYEVYWAPITAGKSNALEVLRWILPQALNAIRLLRSDWTGQGRMRRLTLHRMWAERIRQGPNDHAAEFKTLLEAYSDFLDPSLIHQREHHAIKSTKSFPNYLNEWLPAHHTAPTTSAKVIALARAWQRELVMACWRDMFTLLLLPVLLIQVIVLLVTLLASSFVLLGQVSVFKSLTATITSTFGLGAYLDAIRQFTVGYEYLKIAEAFVLVHIKFPGIWLLPAIVLAGTWFALWNLQLFLRDFLGDVQLWTTYQENNTKHATREEILTCARSVFDHVLHNEDCAGITVIAHSLGSTIMLDALSRLGREARAEQSINPTPGPDSLSERIKKIKYFITLGSPIDKVYFFFESRRVKLKELDRLIEHQRGDITLEPLKNLTWLNFFDQGDPVSGTVFSANPASNLMPFVRNVEVSNYAYPSISSHGGYFLHRDVLNTMYDAAFDLPIDIKLPLSTAQKANQTTQSARWFYPVLLTIPILALLTFAPGESLAALRDGAAFGLLCCGVYVGVNGIRAGFQHRRPV